MTTTDAPAKSAQAPGRDRLFIAAIGGGFAGLGLLTLAVVFALLAYQQTASGATAAGQQTGDVRGILLALGSVLSASGFGTALVTRLNRVKPSPSASQLTLEASAQAGTAKVLAEANAIISKSYLDRLTKTENRLDAVENALSDCQGLAQTLRGIESDFRDLFDEMWAALPDMAKIKELLAQEPPKTPRPRRSAKPSQADQI